MIEQQVPQRNMKKLKGKIDNKVQRILWLIANGKSIEGKKEAVDNSNLTIAIQTEADYDDYLNKNVSSTVMTRREGDRDRDFDISEFLDFPKLSSEELNQVQYGKPYTPQNRTSGQILKQKKNFEIAENSSKKPSTERRSSRRISTLSNFQTEANNKRRRSSVVIQIKKSDPIPSELYSNMMKEIATKVDKQRQENALPNLVRERLLRQFSRTLVGKLKQ